MKLVSAMYTNKKIGQSATLDGNYMIFTAKKRTFLSIVEKQLLSVLFQAIEPITKYVGLKA